MSAIFAVLSLVEAQLTGGIGQSTVALNPSRSPIGWIDFARQSLSVVRLGGIAALACYLLWRSGIRLSAVGITRRPTAGDLPVGIGLAVLPGLAGTIAARVGLEALGPFLVFSSLLMLLVNQLAVVSLRRQGAALETVAGDL